MSYDTAEDSEIVERSGDLHADRLTERRAGIGAEGAIKTEAAGRPIILDLKDLTDGNGFRSDVDA